jgi:RHS repeat-associated protein
VRLASQSDDGVDVAEATYKPYGSLESHAGTRAVLGFAGQYNDTETGFLYMRARYLDSVTGQFISRDPLREETESPFEYAGGNPAANIDPSGLACILGHSVPGPGGRCKSKEDKIRAALKEASEELCDLLAESGLNRDQVEVLSTIVDIWEGTDSDLGREIISGMHVGTQVDILEGMEVIDSARSCLDAGGSGYACGRMFGEAMTTLTPILGDPLGLVWKTFLDLYSNCVNEALYDAGRGMNGVPPGELPCQPGG